MLNKKFSLLMALLVIGTMLMAACEPETIVEQVIVTQVVEKEVEVTKIVEGETIVETVIETVVEEVVVEVTAVPEPVEAAIHRSPRPRDLHHGHVWRHRHDGPQPRL